MAKLLTKAIRAAELTRARGAVIIPHDGADVVVPVYTTPPLRPAYPYCIAAQTTGVPWDTLNGPGQRVTSTWTVFTDRVDDDDAEQLAIMDCLKQLLTGTPFELSAAGIWISPATCELDETFPGIREGIRQGVLRFAYEANEE
jgi:hypothetical protein